MSDGRSNALAGSGSGWLTIRFGGLGWALVGRYRVEERRFLMR
jgi:hypothetical protein